MLVTGAAGFVGSHLVDRLRTSGHRVYGLDYRTRAAINWEYLQGRDDVHLALGDVLCRADVDTALRVSGAAIVFHLAAESHVDESIRHPITSFEVNAVGTMTTAMACVEASVPIVYCSTDEVYGDLAGTPWEATGAYEDATPLRPSSPYSAGKAAGEHAIRALARSLGLRAVITRGCNAFGTRQLGEKLVPTIVRRIHDRRPTALHDGGYQVRQWVAVEEFAKILEASGEYLLDQVPRGGVEVFNIAGPVRCSVRDLVRFFYEVGRGSYGDGIDREEGGARPGQDRCYHISGERTASVLGIRPGMRITDYSEIRRLVDAYPATTAATE